MTPTEKTKISRCTLNRGGRGTEAKKRNKKKTATGTRARARAREKKEGFAEQR